MSFLEMEPAGVFGSGHAVGGHTVTAQELAGRYLTSLWDTQGVVTHPRVVAALDTYYLGWVFTVHGLAVDIENLGVGTSSSAVLVADADGESTTALTTTAAVAAAATGQLTGPLTAR